ncbi:MAG: PilT/PilU family type 4a pilus ATPase [Candidatus Rokuibacteriota bacterium]
MIDFDELLQAAMQRGPSDLHLRPGQHPVIRVNGRLTFMKEWSPLQQTDVEGLARRFVSADQWRHLGRSGGVNIPLVDPALGRFRLAVYTARGLPCVALRSLGREIPSVTELNLPPVVSRLAMERRGLVLVTGPSGCGKSTTLAAMVHLMNLHRNDHIVTIEDPIEYVFENGESYITQREIGSDTPNYPSALRLVLRQDPNVIVVGEMRDPEAFQAVLMLAQTGHLVLSTLHTGSAVDTINRIVASPAEHGELSVRAQLAHVLKGIISQRLVERADGTGVIPATEILVSTSSVVRAILEPELTRRIPAILARGRDLFGMQTFDQCVLDLYLKGIITESTALRACNSPMDFEVQLRRLRQEQRIAETGGEEPRTSRVQMEAILVLEVVGLTDLLISHGDATFGKFVDRIESQLGRIVKGRHARVVEKHLDGFLMTFPNVDWAVLAIRDIWDRLSEFNQLSEKEVAFRGSLHYGRTWVDPRSNRVGAAVHKAFRVCAAIDTPDLWPVGGPKEKNVVVATEEAREVLLPFNVSSRPLGGVPLKGFAGLHHLYELNL